MKKKQAQPKKVSSTKQVKPTRPRGESGAEVFPIVGIGASAGGVEACSDLLANLAPDMGMAYVFVLHLSPDHVSYLSQVFQRKSAMPVVQAVDGMHVKPDHVYVIPPNTFMGLEGTSLRLKTRGRREAPFHPIDFFFFSLVQLRKDRSIGVLLSGTATDGTLGLKMIKESGGISFAQDHSAVHDQMPRSAIDAGYVDFVATPKVIAHQLSFLVSHPYNQGALRGEALKKNEAIKRALDVILQKKGVDFFSNYKRNTVYRRIMRRMALSKIKRLSDYTIKLKSEDGEVDALFHDFLINVTSFFREPVLYEAMTKAVFPALLKNREPAEPFRIWIAGCATGEEAYSTAICLTEFLEQKKLSNPIQIFSTDLNGKAIEKARAGIYPKSLLEHVPARRLKKFFVNIDGHYQVIKSIREMCIFSQHDLLKDPPFSRIDLVSCQNVLIYLETAPQKRLLSSFHYALRPGGFLLIGKSESITNAGDLFQASRKDNRLFIRTPSLRPSLDFGQHTRPGPPAPYAPATPVVRTEHNIEKESDKLLLTRYVPASVLVDKDLEIIRFRGSVSDFIEPASGKASLNLLKMVKDEFLFELRTVIQRAKKAGLMVVSQNVLTGNKTSTGPISIEVTPIKSSKDIYYLVVFKHTFQEQLLPEKGKRASPGAQRAEVRRLEQALANASEHIRSTNEEFEAGRQDLQSANEEILSSNEELQSINEELETSKEELQSANEELTTINDELLHRNEELKQSRDYVEAIIETMRGPLMVLTPELRIRTANRAFLDFFRMREEDTEGALIYDLADRQWNIPALVDQIRNISPKETDFKDFMIQHDFPGVGNRTMIVNAHKMLTHEAGDEFLILLSFEDITRYKIAEQSLLESQQQLRLALIGGSVGTWTWNIKTSEVLISSQEEQLYGLPEGASIKTYSEWERYIHPLDVKATRQALNYSIEKKVPLDTEFRIRWPDGGTHWILAKANTYYDQTGAPEKMVGVNIDITERRTAIEALEESEKRFHAMSDNAPVMIWMTGPDRQTNFLNKTLLNFSGKTMEQESGEGWFDGIHPEDKAAFLQAFNSSFEAQREFKIDYRLRRYDGEYRWIMTHGVPRFSGDRFIGFIGTCIDITERIDLERQKDDFMGIASHELKTPVTSIKAYAQILQEKFRKASDSVSADMLGRLDSQIDKLTDLINTLLDVAKIQSGQMDYHFEYFDVREFLQEIADEMQPASPRHNIETKIQAEGKIFGDRGRLGQVLRNLIGNAVKYSPDAKSVIVEVSVKKNDYVFRVQDFGLGIRKDVQDKVFGRFFRVHDSSGMRVSGLGLGLFISSQIVRQHGGKLWLESEPGKGSVFYFSLPDVHP